MFTVAIDALLWTVKLNPLQVQVTTGPADLGPVQNLSFSGLGNTLVI